MTNVREAPTLDWQRLAVATNYLIPVFRNQNPPTDELSESVPEDLMQKIVPASYSQGDRVFNNRCKPGAGVAGASKASKNRS